MCVRNLVKISGFLAVVGVLSACGDMDALLSSTGAYKVSAHINGFSLDDCAYIAAEDKIQPYFEESVSNDPDITALVIFLRDSAGEITGVKATYKLDENYIDLDDEPDLIEENLYDQQDIESSEKSDNNETKDALTEIPFKEQKNEVKYKNGEEVVFTVNTLNKNLPFYPLPEDLPMDKYSIVYQVMGKKQILQKTEKSFFYLADTVFLFKGIQMYLPGVAENALLIPKGTVVMLEAKLEHDDQLDPYIVWYYGKSILSEGNFTKGAGNILWKAPDQSGFFLLRAEVFPALPRQGLAGVSKDTSLLVSSNTPNMYSLQDKPEFMHCYLFEGDLSDSKTGSPEWVLTPDAKTKPKWLPADGIYGLAAGVGDFYNLPQISFSKEEINNWRIFFRFMPVNNGDYFSVQFGPFFDVTMKLSKNENNLVLTLASPVNVVSQKIDMPQTELFAAAGIDFSVQPGQLSAVFNQGGVLAPISIEAEVDKGYKIILGSQNKSANKETDGSAAQISALWDEFVLLNPLLIEEHFEEVEEEWIETEEVEESYAESSLES